MTKNGLWPACGRSWTGTYTSKHSFSLAASRKFRRYISLTASRKFRRYLSLAASRKFRRNLSLAAACKFGNPAAAFCDTFQYLIMKRSPIRRGGGWPAGIGAFPYPGSGFPDVVNAARIPGLSRGTRPSTAGSDHHLRAQTINCGLRPSAAEPVDQPRSHRLASRETGSPMAITIMPAPIREGQRRSGRGPMRDRGTTSKFMTSQTARP